MFETVGGKWQLLLWDVWIKVVVVCDFLIADKACIQYSESARQWCNVED